MRLQYPWEDSPLDEWAIVGMNHYFIDGERHVFVAMVKGDRCIKAESRDEGTVFRRLKSLAENKGKV